MSLDQTGISLGIMISNAVQALNPPSTINPIAANATAPNFAYSAMVTAQVTTYQAGDVYMVIDFANPPVINSYVPLAYIYDLPNDAADGYVLDGYYQLIPDGYYTASASSAQQQVWITVAQQVLSYLVNNADVTVNNVTGIIDSTGHACESGSATGTPTAGGLS